MARHSVFPLIAGGLLLASGGVALYVGLRRSAALPAAPSPPLLPPAMPSPAPAPTPPPAAPASSRPAGTSAPRRAPSSTPPTPPDLSPGQVRAIGGGVSIPPMTTPAAAPPPTVRALRVGMTGDDVKALQQHLNELGYPVDADGSFGPKTAAALRGFQGSVKTPRLVADGVYGPQTRAALEQAYAKKLVAGGAISLGPAT